MRQLYLKELATEKRGVNQSEAFSPNALFLYYFAGWPELIVPKNEVRTKDPAVTLKISNQLKGNK